MKGQAIMPAVLRLAESGKERGDFIATYIGAKLSTSCGIIYEKKFKRLKKYREREKKEEEGRCKIDNEPISNVPICVLFASVCILRKTGRRGRKDKGYKANIQK